MFAEERRDFQRCATGGVAELFVSRRAEADLASIWRYIASDNPAAADRVFLRIDARMQILRRFPEIGALRNDFRRGMRMLVEGNYLLLYEYDIEERRSRAHGRH